MPKLKPDKAEQAHRTIRAVISENSELYGVNIDLIEKRLGMCPQTFRKRMDNPDTFTLGELRELSEALSWTPVQMASVVRGRPITSKEARDFILM